MPRSSETFQTRSNASDSLSASRRRISSRSQKSRPRSCTHSKYETVTPPAFVRMSGSTGMPRSARIAVAVDRRRAVRALGDEPAAQVAGVRAGDLILARGEHEDVALELEQLLVRDPLDAVLVALERAVLGDVRVQRRDVEPVRSEARRPRCRRRRSRARPCSCSSVAAIPPTLPKPCTTQRCSASVPAEPLARALDHHHDAGSRRLVPEDRAADRDRLAGDDLGHGVALLHRVRVHHPGHRLLVRRHVGRRDVELRAR